jgi:hypothetical protein
MYRTRLKISILFALQHSLAEFHSELFCLHYVTIYISTTLLLLDGKCVLWIRLLGRSRPWPIKCHDNTYLTFHLLHNCLSVKVYSALVKEAYYTAERYKLITTYLPDLYITFNQGWKKPGFL